MTIVVPHTKPQRVAGVPPRGGCCGRRSLLPGVVVALNPAEALVHLRHRGGGLVDLLVLQRLLRVAVEEEVHLDIPRHTAGDRAAQAQHLAGQQPVHHADGVAAAVVARNGNVHKLQRGVRVAEGNHGDVHKAGLTKGLVVRAGVRDKQHARLHELLLDLVREGAGDEAASQERRADKLRELEDGALTKKTRGADSDVLRVFHRGDDAGGEDQLLPRHVEVNDVRALLRAAVDVLLHGVAAVLGAEVAVHGNELLHVALLHAEDLGARFHRGHSDAVGLSLSATCVSRTAWKKKKTKKEKKKGSQMNKCATGTSLTLSLFVRVCHMMARSVCYVCLGSQ
ncbi:hypothetical protein ECC02_005148 [Trypanosoma cruzi]|uniref:Uncharacterized protein n=1 Tax=Trypanosoma cruzi TaxID=5693 RepID=A0A7J6Y540_TRYCR|nr:hypothetical protein ECC02_005148 [Trypanosoma cruzi]